MHMVIYRLPWVLCKVAIHLPQVPRLAADPFSKLMMVLELRAGGLTASSAIRPSPLIPVHLKILKYSFPRLSSVLLKAEDRP